MIRALLFVAKEFRVSAFSLQGLNKLNLNLARLSKTFSVGLVKAPENFVGKKIKELDLFATFKINCVGVKRDKEFVSINENYTILHDDELIVSGKNDDIAEFDKK